MKTNLPLKGHHFSDEKNTEHAYINIHTTILDKLQPKLVFKYSSTPQMHYGESKLVLSHKMYGFPFLDFEGIYGISNRDNYVFNNHSPRRVRDDQRIFIHKNSFISVRSYAI